MKTKTWLLAGAAAGVFAVTLGATTADAAVKHKAPATASLAAENQALKDQVAALAARLDALEASQTQTKAAAEQAQATATAAQQQTADVKDDIENIPGQINLAVAEVPKPKKTWIDNTSISGRMYYDVSSISQKSNGVKVPASGVGFDIKRFYVGIDHKFNDIYSANVTTDFQYSSAISSTELYLKKAYLQAKYSDALTVRVGAADLPWIPFVEDIYGYRFVDQTLTDRTKFGTSADWGVHALGKIGIFNYQVSVIDGAGYKAPLRSKGMDIEGRVNAKIDDFTVAVGGYSGKLGKEPYGVTTFHTASRFNALAAYTNAKFRVGVEYFTASNWNQVLAVAPDKSDGYSVFGSFNVNDQFSVFGRYDYEKPTKLIAPTRKDGYFNIGINYEPVKIVDFALVYKHDKVQNGSLATGNATIGGSRDGTYDELGLFGQLRW